MRSHVRFISRVRHRGKEFIRIEKKIGQRDEPYGTPEVTESQTLHLDKQQLVFAPIYKSTPI